ncbi:MAG: response regulator transcription factor [Bacteroidetes bacterium]|nr:response regulator transcription factor [Bacteroidota bacterium]
MLHRMKIQVGVVDDMQLFLKSLCYLIDSFKNFEVSVDALNGEQLLEKMAKMDQCPDIILVDVNMPVMDGLQTAENVLKKYPIIKLVALSLQDDDTSVINMLKAGCCAYLLKDIHPDELQRALGEVYNKGYYNADLVNINYRRLITKAKLESENRISDKEKIFLNLSCSDLTYKQIAIEMKLSERTIDGFRESLFNKLNVESRVGMVLEGLRRNLVRL